MFRRPLLSLSISLSIGLSCHSLPGLPIAVGSLASFGLPGAGWLSTVFSITLPVSCSDFS